MNDNVYILGGYQTDFARNWHRENKHISALMREAYEEIADGAFKTCICELRKQYNIILLDSSPILAMADATILSSQVDGTIMVERELVSQRANVIDALARLSSAGGCLLGTVFVGSQSCEKYGYSYHYNRTSEL